MSDNGWIKIHRKIVNNWVWDNPEYFRAWIDILLMVNHREKKLTINGKLITIKRGEKLTSIVKLADRWHWSRNRVKRFLDLLEQDAMCTTNRSAFGTTLKVSNYEEYQGFQTPVRTAFEPSNESTNGSAVGSTVGPQTIMNKESSNNVNNFFSGADAQKKFLLTVLRLRNTAERKTTTWTLTVS
jgi:DNA replication protein DnaD